MGSGERPLLTWKKRCASCKMRNKKINPQLTTGTRNGVCGVSVKTKSVVWRRNAATSAFEKKVAGHSEYFPGGSGLTLKWKDFAEIKADLEVDLAARASTNNDPSSSPSVGDNANGVVGASAGPNIADSISTGY